MTRSNDCEREDAEKRFSSSQHRVTTFVTCAAVPFKMSIRWWLKDVLTE
jgi:hypothetical protein